MYDWIQPSLNDVRSWKRGNGQNSKAKSVFSVLTARLLDQAANTEFAFPRGFIVESGRTRKRTTC